MAYYPGSASDFLGARLLVRFAGGPQGLVLPEGWDTSRITGLLEVSYMHNFIELVIHESTGSKKKSFLIIGTLFNVENLMH